MPEQPAPIPNDTEPLWDRVIARMHRVIERMKSRDAVGLERYKTRLQANNGRDMLLDALEEQLDHCVYLEGEIEHRDALLAKLARLNSEYGLATRAIERIILENERLKAKLRDDDRMRGTEPLTAKPVDANAADPRCKNCGQSIDHPHYVKKCEGYCYGCWNHGVPDKDDEIARLKEENVRLRADIATMAERIHAQSELLSNKAEKIKEGAPTP